MFALERRPVVDCCRDAELMASPKASKEDQLQQLFTQLAPLIKGQQHKKAVRKIDASK